MDDYVWGPERLEADGFVLRCWREEDGPAIGAAVRGSYEHLRPWMPWAQPDQTDEHSTRLARQFRGRWLAGIDFVTGILAPDDRTVLGGTGFHLRHGDDTGIAEIGMWIAADHAGKGLGTRALTAMLGWGFSDAWPWRRLLWKCDARNAASARVAEKAGMLREARLRRHERDVDGEWRDSLLFGALREDWRPPR